MSRLRLAVWGLAALLALVGGSALSSAEDADKAAAKAKETPWLGIVMAPGSHGVEISEVIPLSPAEAGGIKVGDQLFELDGQSVSSMRHLHTIIQAMSVGDEITVRVWRDDGKRTLHTTLARFPTEDEIFSRRLLNSPPPALVATVVSGNGHADLTKYRGDVVLLGFWGRGQSIKTAAWMNELATQYREQGLAVVGVSQLGARPLASWADDNGLSYTILADTDNTTHDALHIGYEATSWAKPTALVLVDRDGLVRFAASAGLGRHAARSGAGEVGASVRKDTVAAIEAALEERNGLAIE
jgi:peroxiredoxin